MGTITRQILICLVIGLFICGLHCEILKYPEPASCEYDFECLRGKAKCVRRECHCMGSYDYGDGKNDCTKWRECTKEVCPENSHCLMHPENSKVTCKCDDGYFGRANDPECRNAAKRRFHWLEYPCLTEKNCPTFSICSTLHGGCGCRDEYWGDGEFCYKKLPLRCDHPECSGPQSKCMGGLCRCVGEYVIGDGYYCRATKPCNSTCGKNAVCMLDPLFPNIPRCECRSDSILNVYGDCLDCLQDSDCGENLQTCIAQVCTCKDGLARGDDKKCKPGPLHPCQDNNDCDTRATCIKGKCFCQASSTGNGKYCRNSQPCKGNRNCDGNSKCVVDPLIPDQKQCVCNDGFRKTDDGKCVELTECFNLNGRDCPFGQICSQVSGGSYNCTCPEGYELITSGGNSSCQDVDECSDRGICPANSVCENSEGSYECICNNGYAKNDNGVCEDKDECFDKVDACGAHEKCVNKHGGHFCECKKGYVKKNGACVKGVRLKAGSAQVSPYVRTFILGVLGSLAFSA